VHRSEPIVEFDSIIGQQRPVRILATLLRNGSIPHAFLFSGIEGIGKRTAAMTFAMACNCKSSSSTHRTDSINPPSEEDKATQKPPVAANPCGICRSCRKIQSGNHPDIIHVEPSGSIIRIAQIRNLCHILAMKPYEARSRVVIISDAHTMNPESGNALLKVLEEPPARTILILITLQASDLLPTIISRCQHIKFNPIPGKILETYLVEKQGVVPVDAAILAAMSKGSFSRARIMNRINWIKKRNWLIKAIGFDKPADLSSMPLDSLLAFAEKLSKNRKELIESLEVLKSWIRDLVIYRYSPEKVINKDLMDKIMSASQQANTSMLLSSIEVIQSAEKDIRANSNLRLTTETLIMRLTGQIRGYPLSSIESSL